MALVLNDRVKETSTTTGTGTLDLDGAVTGFEGFVTGIATGNTTYYCIAHTTADEWEVGLGTVTDAGTDTLSRDTVISSSNSDGKVVFTADEAEKMNKDMTDSIKLNLPEGFDVNDPSTYPKNN